MNKMTLLGQFSKTLGYLAFGLNNVLRFVGTATSKVGNVVKRFKPNTMIMDDFKRLHGPSKHHKRYGTNHAPHREQTT